MRKATYNIFRDFRNLRDNRRWWLGEQFLQADHPDAQAYSISLTSCEILSELLKLYDSLCVKWS